MPGRPGRPGRPGPREPTGECMTYDCTYHHCNFIQYLIVYLSWNTVYCMLLSVSWTAVINCARQKEQSVRHRDHLCCEDDGSFCPIQCSSPKMCHCVDTETGEKLNNMKYTMQERDSGSINCTTGIDVTDVLIYTRDK